MVKSGDGEDAEVNFKETMDQLNSKKLKAKDSNYVVKENTNDTELMCTLNNLVYRIQLLDE